MEKRMIVPKEKFMHLAIEEAKRAYKNGDYAIGAALVKDNKVIAVAGNRIKLDESPIAHAETLAIIKATKLLKHRHLEGCILYTTHEPCPMCASVAVWARLHGVVYGARINDMKRHRNKFGNHKYLWRTIAIPCKTIFAKSTEKVEVVSDFMRKECVNLFHS